jgi:hypothetical protein
MHDSKDIYSKPSEIFAKYKLEVQAALRDDAGMQEAFKRLQSFKGVFNTPEHAKRLDELKAKGADQLNIGISNLPLLIGAGLVYMYDVAIEAIRSEPERVDSKAFRGRALHTAESLFDVWLLNVGACGVTAIERALEDEEYANRLSYRATELGWIAFDDRPPQDVCPFCTVIRKGPTGNIEEIQCPSEQECNDLLWLILLLLALWLTYKLIKWLWD